MKDLGYALGSTGLVLLRLGFRTLISAGYLLAVLVRPLVERLARARSGFKLADGHPLRDTVPIQTGTAINVPGERDQHPGGAAREPDHRFMVASRIVSMRLLPPVGVINLRVYEDQRLVKRDLIINEPRLRSMMRGRRHSFPDAAYDAATGLDRIKSESIALAENLINRLGTEAVSERKPHKQRAVRATADANGVSDPEVTAPAADIPVQAPQQATAQSQHLAPGQLVAPQARPGFTYVGRLVKAGSTTVRPWGRPPFDIFEVTLALENGAAMALRGAELERELSAQGCGLGEQVAITPMGKVPVTLGNGEEGQKNLYQVRRMEVPAAPAP
jgi:hypothetical protein